MERPKDVMRYMNIDFADVLTLLLNLDPNVDLSICKNIVSDIMYNLNHETLKQEINNYFYTDYKGQRLEIDYPIEWEKLVKIFGCIAL